MIFQVLALAVVFSLLILSLLAMRWGWATRRESLIWALVWLVAVTSVIARALGIGRGADLVLYCAVVVMMVGFLMVYVRMRRIRRELTLLVRELAIRDAVVTSVAEPPDKASTSNENCE